MGTRAIITKNKRPFVATHWDGDPGSLGVELISARTDSEILAVAKRHQIDFAAKNVLRKLKDKTVSPISNYDDYAEYQYNLSRGKWTFRELHGSWKQSRSSSTKFEELR